MSVASRLRVAVGIHIAALLVLHAALTRESWSDDQTTTGSQTPSRLEEASSWKMETLERTDGKVFHGLIEHRKKDEIKFAEIRRPPGNPWFLVIHYYHPDSVKTLTRLPLEDRKQLVEQITPLLREKSRARIEAGRMEEVKLSGVERDGRIWFVGDGQWFLLESSADEETTRRCFVRIEQIFRAYEQVFPTKTTPTRLLRIILHGSMSEYRADLSRRELQVGNPAIFSTEQNLILAGSELTQYAQRVEQIRAQNEEIRQLYKRKDAEFKQRLTQLAKDLAEQGFSKKEITFELTIRNAKWKADNKVDGEYWEMMRELNAVDRRNETLFDVVTQDMFRRLYHEAFHAYVENYVYPQSRFFLPRWLNEGWAQVFENSQLDEGTLRIDAPSRELLDQLKTDLRRDASLTLEQLLDSQDGAFLISHNAESASHRHYLYSWGLAYYLTFQLDVVGSEALDEYVSQTAHELPPVVRFETLVDTRLPPLERQWRKYVLQEL